MQSKIQQKLIILQSISGKTQSEIAQDLGVTILSVQAWMSGRSIPRAFRILSLNKLFEKYGIEIINLGDDSKNENEVLRTINTLKIKIPNPLKLILDRPDIFDELTLHSAYNSNTIEGSTMTLDDTKQVIFDKVSLKKRTLNEQLEAKNHDLALKLVFEKIRSSLPVSSDVILELHKVLMGGILTNAGEYRLHPVRIVGSFVPTSNYLRVPELIKKLCQDYKNAKDIKEIFQFHADFEKIHPFSDGNGRLGRLLLIYMLLNSGYAPAIVKNKRKKEYYKALQNAQLKENYDLLNDELGRAVLAGYKLLID